MPDTESLQRHVNEFALKRPLYEALAGRLDDLLKSLLGANSIDYHVVETRAKSLDSFREKITRPGKGYKSPVAEMPDLCGARIITYYQDECDCVADVLKKEFQVLEEELAYHSSRLDADRFGYLSSHYIVKLSKARARLPEWKPYASLRAEIQIRTVIQHAWSAVSHAVQYKEEAQIPSKLQRRLYRIAGLFELADEEFIGIRDQRARLRDEATKELVSGNQQLALSSASLRSFIETWENLPETKKRFTSAGFKLTGPDDEDADIITDIYDLANANGITTIEELNTRLANPDNKFLQVLGAQIRPDEIWTASPIFVANLLLISSFREMISLEYLLARGWDRTYAQRVMNAIEQVKG